MSANKHRLQREKERAYRDANPLGYVPKKYSWPMPEASTFHKQRHAQRADQEANKTKANEPQNQLNCTFKGCQLTFPDQKALIKHKDSEHDYCIKCDMDFPDDETMHVHKMGSEKHIICQICGIDFRSDTGRDRHAKQMHFSQQNIQCRACHKNFAKGAALLLHFEQNQCIPIKANNNPDERVDQREMLEAHRAMMALQLHKVEKEGTSLSGIESEDAASTIAHSVDGGVRVDPSLLDDPEGEAEFNGMIKLQAPLTASNAGSQPPDTASLAGRMSGASAPVNAQTTTSPGSVADHTSVRTTPTWSQTLFPGAKDTPVAGNWKAPSSKAETEDSSTTPGNLNSTNPSPSGIHLIQKETKLERDPLDNMYHCQFPTCDRKYNKIDQIIVHLKAHRGIQHRCPYCYRMFGSASALTAHMESSSTRCNIRESSGYGNALGLVSGGFLGLSGRLEDGSAQMDSNKKPDSFW